MNILMKEFIILTVSLMLSTSCFAMDNDSEEQDSEKSVTVKKISEKNHESAALNEGKPSNFTLPTIEPTSNFYPDYIHNMLVNIASEDFNDFKRMVAVSTTWFHILTGTDKNNPFSKVYPQRYALIVSCPFFPKKYDAQKNIHFEEYSSSPLLQWVHRIRVDRGLSQYSMPMTASRLQCTFPQPTAVAFLNLYYQFVGNDGLKSIEPLTNLQGLSLGFCNLTDSKRLSFLSQFSKLQNLILNFNNLDMLPSNLPDSLTSCRLLHYKADDGPSPNLQSLLHLTNLVRLEIGHQAAGNKTLEWDTATPLSSLSKLSKLQVLNMADNNIGADDWSFLLKLPDLTDLNVYNTSLTPNTAQTLSQCTKLTSLHLGFEFCDPTRNSSAKVVDAVFNNTALTNLTALYLKVIDIKDKCHLLPSSLSFLELGKASLDDIKQLRCTNNLLSLQLDIGWNMQNDEWVEALLKFTSLTALCTPSGQLKNENELKLQNGLSHLTSLKNWP